MKTSRILLATFMALSVTCGTWAEETPSENSVPWVFIPVDENGKPTEDEYYMPFDMFRNLNRKQTDTTSQEMGWVYHSAVYSGSLVYTLSPRDWLVESMKATYSIDVLKPNTKIILPLSPDEAYLSPGSVKLNGVTRKVDWENNRLVLVVPESGRCSLEFSFLPVLMNPGDGGNQRETSGGLISGFHLTIPAIPNSQLELRAPAVFSEITFPSAIGGKEYDNVSRSWIVQLGPTRDLTVRWKTPYTHLSTDSLSVEELYHWNLDKDRMTVRCRYRFLCPENGCEKIEWRTDSRLAMESSSVRVSMLPNTSSQTNGDTVSEITQRPEITFEESGKERILRMTFDTAVHGRLLVAFDLEGDHMDTLGNIPFPEVRSTGTKITRRWISVCPDVSLQTRHDATQPAAVAVPEFLSLWEDFAPEKNDFNTVPMRTSVCVMDDTPFASGTPLPFWTINVRPIPEIRSFQETLACRCSTDSIAVHYQLQPSSTATLPPVLRLKIPENLRVENVLLYEGFQQKPLRFTRTSDQGLTLFTELSDEIRTVAQGPLPRLVLTGIVDLPSRVTTKKPWTADLPEIRIRDENVRTSSRGVEIYRTDDVLVTFTSPRPAGEETTPSTAFVTESSTSPFGSARLVASFSPAPQEVVSGKLSLTPNHPVITAQTRVSLEPLPPTEKTAEDTTPSESKRWNVRLEMQLDVQEGTADAFQLEFSGNQKNPFVLDPPYPYTLETLPADDTPQDSTTEEGTPPLKKNVPERVRMVIRPLRSLSGVSSLTLSREQVESTETLAETGVAMELPVFQFPDFKTVEQEVVLPVSHDSKVGWTTEGMLPIEQSLFSIPFPNDTPRQIFQVVDKHFGAWLQTSSRSHLEPQTVGNSHSLFWNTNAAMLGLTTLDIDPRMSRTCVVEMDKTLCPLEFRLDSQPVQMEEFTPEPSPEIDMVQRRYFRISLRSVNLVQRLEILFRGNTENLRMDGIASQLKTVESFHVRLPRLIQNHGSSEKNAERGTCILYLVGTDPVRLSQEDGKALAVRPVPRIELVRLEQIVRLSRTLSTFRVPTGETVPPTDTPTVDETENWFQLWSPLWNAMLTRVQNHLQGKHVAEYRDYQKELTVLEKEGKERFTANPQSPIGTALVTVFYENIPEEKIAQTLAFDTTKDGGFLLHKTVLPASHRPRFLFQAILVLLVTIGTLLVFFAFPWLLETTRTSPFWLLYVGILWLLCFQIQWVGIFLCIFAVILVGVRFHQKNTEK